MYTVRAFTLILMDRIRIWSYDMVESTVDHVKTHIAFMLPIAAREEYIYIYLLRRLHHECLFYVCR